MYYNLWPQVHHSDHTLSISESRHCPECTASVLMYSLFLLYSRTVFCIYRWVRISNLLTTKYNMPLYVPTLRINVSHWCFPFDRKSPWRQVSSHPYVGKHMVMHSNEIQNKTASNTLAAPVPIRGNTDNQNMNSEHTI